MFVYTTLLLIFCATLVLTSSVSKTDETDGFSKVTHNVVPAEHFRDTDGSSSTPVSPSTTDKNIKNETISLIMGEGGPIYQSQNENLSTYLGNTASKPATTSEAIEQTSNGSTSNDTKSKLPKTRNASVVARKGAVPSSKITARKGVGPEISVPTESSIEDIDEGRSREGSRKKDNKKIQPVSAKTDNDTRNKTMKKKLYSKHTNVNVPANTTNNSSSDVSVNDKKSTTSSTMIKLLPTIETKIIDNTTTTSGHSTKKFKPKPTVTIGEMNADKPIPASPTKTPPLGMPRKIDYIVPVIITIMALPLLGGVTFFLYRRGRDCWDKRHYRRMDFLIDGMYNDYSWK